MAITVINGLYQGTILHGKSYDYEIIKTLGQGSFGITYLASVKMRGELGSIDATVYVAIKECFMHEVNGRDGSSVTSGSKTGVYDKYKGKFIKEAINLSKLYDDNIIRVIEAFEANNTVYYVMEFMDGGSLDDLIKKNNGLSEQEVLQYAVQIGKALKSMHNKNMLHLDLKPSNVMLHDGKAVLIDFGLSKQYDEDGNPESSTTIGGGTAGYAPLEQTNFKGEKKDGLPVTMDIYAFGATLFKMLTGNKPPVASDILNEGFPSDVLSAKGVSQYLIDIIFKAMEPLRKNRYQSMDEVLIELKSLSDNATGEHTSYGNDSETTSLDHKSNSVRIEYKRSDTIPEVVYGGPIPSGFDEQIPEIPSNKKSKNWMIALFIVIGFISVFCVVKFWVTDSNIESDTENPIEYFSDLSGIGIGDYLYADGRYTHELDSTNIDNCSGCVYNLATTDEEKQEGWSHGHIVALKDAVYRDGESNFSWGPINNAMPNSDNYSDAVGYKYGYWYCLLESACQSPAISSLEDFDGSVFEVPLPEGSKWYVPTVADWRDILLSLGNATLNEENSSLVSFDNSTVAPILQKKIGAFPKKMGKKIDDDDYSYWTCIQQGEDWTPDGVLPRAWAIYGHNEFGMIGNSPTRNKMSVRPVAAF